MSKKSATPKVPPTPIEDEMNASRRSVSHRDELNCFGGGKPSGRTRSSIPKPEPVSSKYAKNVGVSKRGDPSARVVEVNRTRQVANVNGYSQEETETTVVADVYDEEEEEYVEDEEQYEENEDEEEGEEEEQQHQQHRNQNRHLQRGTTESTAAALVNVLQTKQMPTSVAHLRELMEKVQTDKTTLDTKEDIHVQQILFYVEGSLKDILDAKITLSTEDLLHKLQPKTKNADKLAALLGMVPAKSESGGSSSSSSSLLSPPKKTPSRLESIAEAQKLNTSHLQNIFIGRVRIVKATTNYGTGYAAGKPPPVFCLRASSANISNWNSAERPGSNFNNDKDMIMCCFSAHGQITAQSDEKCVDNMEAIETSIFRKYGHVNSGYLLGSIINLDDYRTDNGYLFVNIKNPIVKLMVANYDDLVKRGVWDKKQQPRVSSEQPETIGFPTLAVFEVLKEYENEFQPLRRAYCGIYDISTGIEFRLDLIKPPTEPLPSAAEQQIGYVLIKLEITYAFPKSSTYHALAQKTAAPLTNRQYLADSLSK